MRTYHLLFLFLFVSLPVLSQVVDTLTSTNDRALEKKVKSRYKHTSVSIPYRSFRDEGHSPLLYSRLCYQLSLANERIRKNGTTKLEFNFGIGFLKTNKKKVSAVSLAPMLNLEINYHYLRYIKTIFKQKGALYLGGILTNTLDGRLYTSLINNSFGYEFSNVINPTALLTYNFSLGEYQRRCQVGFKTDFALLAHVIRPNFIGMEPVQAYEGESISVEALFIHNNKIALPHQFFRINTKIYIDRFQLSNNNRIRLFYGWGFHSTKLAQSNNLYSSYHEIGLSSIIYSTKVKGSIFKRKISPKI